MIILLKNILLIYFVSSLYLISKKLALVFFKDNKIENILILYIFIFISVTYLIFLSIILGFYNNYIVYLLSLLCLTMPIIFFTEIKNFKFKKVLKDKLFLLFLPYFIISLFPASDADSLDYHLGAAKFWIENETNLPLYNWIHFRLASYGEILNIFSITFFDGKFLSFLKVFLLFLLTKIIFNNFNKKKNINVFLYSLLSSPILIYFISNQKPQFIGYIILIISFLFIISKKKENFTSIFLAYVSSLKFSFLPLVSILFFFAIISNKINRKKFTISFIFFLILFWTPLLIKNYIFYLNPLSPFFENYLSNSPDETVINFSRMLKNYSEYGLSNFYAFLNILLPLSFGSVTTYFGVGILLYILTKNFSKKSKIILILSIIMFLSYFLIGQFSSRYLYLSYFLLIFSSLFFEIRFRVFFYNLLRLQMLIVYLFLISISFLNFASLIHITKYENYLESKAYQYKEAKWIKKNIINENYTSDIRSKYFLNKNHFSIEFIFYTPKNIVDAKLLNFIKKNNIKKVTLLVDDSYIYNKFEFCKKNILSKDFKVLRRNFLAKEKIIKRQIFDLDLDNEKCDIKL